MSKLSSFPSCRCGYGINQVTNLLHRRRQLLLKSLVFYNSVRETIENSRLNLQWSWRRPCTHFHGNVISARKRLSDCRQGGLFNVTNAFIYVVYRIIALPLPRRLVSVMARRKLAFKCWNPMQIKQKFKETIVWIVRYSLQGSLKTISHFYIWMCSPEPRGLEQHKD